MASITSSSNNSSQNQVGDSSATVVNDIKSDEEACLFVIVKHAGKEYKIDNLMQDHTVNYFKEQIYELTNVRHDRQKLFGLKSKTSNTLDDNLQLDDTNISSGMKIMMMGSQEKEIAGVEAAGKSPGTRVEDDFDIGDDYEGADLDAKISEVSTYKAKIARRVKQYRIAMISEPRKGKKLLVLDIDYTLFDHRSTGQNGLELMRPYLHEFLKDSYKNYDIVIWSATNMKYIEAKMQELRVENNPNYNILFYLDSAAMISVLSQKYGYLTVKPLAVIWGKFPDYYSSKNTIMFDDIRRNFLMNPQNGLKIKAFREAHKNRDKDKELLHLMTYLEMIAELDDLSHLDHRNWKYYISYEYSKRHKSS